MTGPDDRTGRERRTLMYIQAQQPTLLAAAFSDELAALAERVRAGVVEVSDGRGTGAGTIWSSDGLVVTNHHVVPGDAARVTLTDDRTLDARVVAAIPERDLTLLKVDASDLPALPVGDSTRLRVGELVIAVGHPHGVPGVVTAGVFSRFGPYEGRAGRHLREGLLADIELRPGNSGGPLVNARGEVVGINAMVLGPGTALAVPSATVSRLLVAGERRTLGVQVQIIQHEATGAYDLMILDVASDSVAERAGLLPGDILRRIAGEAIEEPGDIPWALNGLAPDATVVLAVQRAGRIHEAVATLTGQG
jgi:serine protease Do